MKARVPAQYADQPELVRAIIGARRVQMETEDDAAAIRWLLKAYPMSIQSATRVINDETFRYTALYPEGHPDLESLRAEGRQKSRRTTELRKIRSAVIERDGGRCQNCKKRVWGKEATLDHKDPEGPATMENIHLLCRACNTLKGRRAWAEFQKANAEWHETLKKRQNERPDFTCKRSGLSVRGRSWKEAGCLTPSLCLHARGCDNGGHTEWAEDIDEFVRWTEEFYDADDKKRLVLLALRCQDGNLAVDEAAQQIVMQESEFRAKAAAAGVVLD